VAGVIPEAGLPAEVRWFSAQDSVLGGVDLAELGEEEKARAAAFAFPADRHRFQAAHVMLRRVLARHLGARPGELVFGREPCPRCGGPSGRPVLASGPCFSLAHSGDMIVIAVASRPVGVDLERQTERCLCFLTGTMHPADAAMVAPLREPDRHQAILRWWVRAEAALKCAGAGIAHGLDAAGWLGTGSRGSQQVMDLAAPPGYRAALAVAAPAGNLGLVTT
jgi:4'-phosphopantetheinyl transferase